MYYVHPQLHYPQWPVTAVPCYYPTTQQTTQPTRPNTKHPYQLPDKFPQLANRLATFAQKVKNGTLNMSQVETELSDILKQIPVETIAAGLKAVSFMLSHLNTGKVTPHEALIIAGHALQGAANQLSSIKEKFKPKTTTT